MSIQKFGVILLVANLDGAIQARSASLGKKACSGRFCFSASVFATPAAQVTVLDCFSLEAVSCRCHTVAGRRTSIR